MRNPAAQAGTHRQMAGWQSGYAAACKAVDVGSIPAPASIFGSFDPTPDPSECPPDARPLAWRWRAGPLSAGPWTRVQTRVLNREMPRAAMAVRLIRSADLPGWRNW